jgi:hypothetical protein
MSDPREIAATDAEIDELVYELYGITEEERKITEASQGCILADDRSEQNGTQPQRGRSDRGSGIPQTLQSRQAARLFNAGVAA